MPDTSTSPLLGVQQDVERPDYSDKEQTYLGGLQRRLLDARNTRERKWDEFDGMSYTKYCEENRKGANSYIKPRENEAETNFVTGTTRDKLLAILSYVINLDLGPDIEAFNQQNQIEVDMGETMEDTVDKTLEMERDREHQLMRFYTLAEQGTVFVEETWDVQFKKTKALKKALRDYKGEVSGVTWEERLEKVFEGPRRKIVKNEHMYLGSYTVFEQDDQPFMFTVEHRPFEETKSIYGGWERWKHVHRKQTNISEQVEGIYNSNWRLTQPADDSCEIIKYQDRWNDEYMIIINGVMMLPVGMPLPWRNGRYNVEKQVWELIDAHFPLGKSLISRLKVAQGMEDEMWRLAILKTQQSFLLPRGNNTGKVLSSRIFFPGRFTPGIDPKDIPPLVEGGGPTSGEVAMLQMLAKNLDDNSIDPTTQGQQATGNQTATEVVALRRQAEKMLGIMVLSCSLLEEKLAYLRLDNILANFFDPVDQRFDEVRNQIVDQYRSFVRMKPIDSRGMGAKITRIAKRDTTPQPEDIYAEEKQLAIQLGMPVRIAYVDPETIKQVKYTWYIKIVPKERKTSDLRKILWDQFLERMKLFPNANWEYLGNRTAEIYEENPSKVFSPTAPAAATPGAMPGATPTPTPSTPAAVTDVKAQAGLGSIVRNGTV